MSDYRQLLKVDNAADDSDKQWEVPRGFLWRIDGLYIDFTANSGGASRYLALDVADLDASDAANRIFWSTRIINGIAASQNEFITGHPHIGNSTEDVATFHMIGVPSFWIPEGFIVHVWDASAIDNDDDDMLVSLWISERSEL